MNFIIKKLEGHAKISCSAYNHQHNQELRIIQVGKWHLGHSKHSQGPVGRGCHHYIIIVVVIIVIIVIIAIIIIVVIIIVIVIAIIIVITFNLP